MGGWSEVQSAIEKLKDKAPKHWVNYYGFYSSWLGGFYREPWAMMVPMDDHLVHRGDGVFEAVRLFENSYFDFEAHLARLQRSAGFLGLQLPKPIEEIKAIAINLAKLCEQPNAILRLYVSRGPGGFGTSPYESIGSQLYMALTKITPPSMEQYERGVRAFICETPAKEPPYSGVKSCNYLQNVLMKKESVDRGFDFALSVNATGVVCEGSTENFAVITAENELLAPKFDYTLRGTTLLCVLELAEQLVKSGELKAVRLQDILRQDLARAKEMAFIGTTLGVLPVCEVHPERTTVVQHFPLFDQLGKMLMNEIKTNARRRTPVL